MTITLLLAIVLSLAVWTVVLSRHRRHRAESALGPMSQQWIAEQRATESRHRPA